MLMYHLASLGTFAPPPLSQIDCTLLCHMASHPLSLIYMRCDNFKIKSRKRQFCITFPVSSLKMIFRIFVVSRSCSYWSWNLLHTVNHVQAPLQMCGHCEPHSCLSIVVALQRCSASTSGHCGWVCSKHTGRLLGSLILLWCCAQII